MLIFSSFTPDQPLIQPAAPYFANRKPAVESGSQDTNQATNAPQVFSAFAKWLGSAYPESMTKKARLNKTDWLLAGFAALAEDGPDALKAEPLARRLGTTKGSFYWHFTDVPAYHAAMLDLWAEQATTHIPAELDAEPTPAAKLRRLSQIIAAHRSETLGGVKLDTAIRAWSRANPVVADRLAQVDGQRLGYLENLLQETGITNPEWARIIYAADIGMEDLTSRDGHENTSAMGSLVDLVLALR